jgi:hypothetical protein
MKWQQASGGIEIIMAIGGVERKKTAGKRHLAAKMNSAAAKTAARRKTYRKTDNGVIIKKSSEASRRKGQRKSADVAWHGTAEKRRKRNGVSRRRHQ